MMPGMNFKPCDLVGIPFPSIVSEKKFAPILGVNEIKMHIFQQRIALDYAQFG